MLLPNSSRHLICVHVAKNSFARYPAHPTSNDHEKNYTMKEPKEEIDVIYFFL
jgi:hypothetical protein